MKPTVAADEMFPEGVGPYMDLEEAGGPSNLLMDLAANEKAVHADFFNDFSTKSDAEIRQACTNFKEHYFEDIEPEFLDEMVQFKYFILQLEDAGKTNVPAEESYKLIIDFEDLFDDDDLK